MIALISKTPKRPRDPSQPAKLMVDIATEDDTAKGRPTRDAPHSVKPSEGHPLEGIGKGKLN